VITEIKNDFDVFLYFMSWKRQHFIASRASQLIFVRGLPCLFR